MRKSRQQDFFPHKQKVRENSSLGAGYAYTTMRDYIKRYVGKGKASMKKLTLHGAIETDLKLMKWENEKKIETRYKDLKSCKKN